MISVTQTHFLVYKITNIKDGKTYIGCHKTKDPDDSYMGSGKYLKRAQTKHGLENFKKEILFDFDNSEDMFAKEKQLIAELDPDYNLHEGGRGGWEYVNSNGLSVPISENNRSTGAAAAHQVAAKCTRVKSYVLSPVRCGYCNTAIEYERRANTYCSSRCFAKDNNDKRSLQGWRLSEEAKSKIRQSVYKTLGTSPRSCSDCKVKIQGRSISGLCATCLRKSRLPNEFVENIPRLSTMLKSMSARRIGRMYSVGHGTVLRYSKKYTDTP